MSFISILFLNFSLYSFWGYFISSLVIVKFDAYLLEVLVSQSCPTLCDPMDCSLPGLSVHGILQATLLEWVVILFSRGLPDPGIEPSSPMLHSDSLLSESLGST